MNKRQNDVVLWLRLAYGQMVEAVVLFCHQKIQTNRL
jgi:hypothetical protein